MSHVALLLDKARKRRSIASDNALAARMDKSRQTISQWRSGVRHPTDDDVLALCAMAEVDCGEWLALVAAERAHGKAAAAWTALARRLGAAATVAAVALFNPSPATAADGVEAARTMHYAHMRRRIAAALRRLLAGSRHGHPAALLPA